MDKIGTAPGNSPRGIIHAPNLMFPRTCDWVSGEIEVEEVITKDVFTEIVADFVTGEVFAETRLLYALAQAMNTGIGTVSRWAHGVAAPPQAGRQAVVNWIRMNS